MIQLAFLFAPGHGIYWLIGVLIVIVIYKRKSILMGLLNLLLIPIAVVIAVLSGIVGYTPKWLKDEGTKDDDKPKKYNNIIF